jgi:hypothetical protein
MSNSASCPNEGLRIDDPDFDETYVELEYEEGCISITQYDELGNRHLVLLSSRMFQEIECLVNQTIQHPLLPSLSQHLTLR